ncbi:MAG: S1 RNA-binding domain-containing protein [Clostridia bacterium]|nr:S1 RNA-binding domain-containing protein [Clostridia bacterium]
MISSAYLPEGSLIDTDENREYLSSLEGLERAMNEGRILEAAAIRCSGTLTLTVSLGEYCGTIERDEAALTAPGEAVKDIAVITRVGKPVCFKVMRIERPSLGGVQIILSRRAAQRECAENFLSALTPGDIIPAKVTHLEHFGAFMDIGCGIVSLLSIDCISVSRITHPRDRLTVGSELDVVVKSVEHDADGKAGRIFVSRKELLGTWEENASLFAVGQTVTGIVRSVEAYGVFVELTPNLAGLAEYRGDVSVGQTAAVYIKNIIPERMKVKLVIIDAYRGIGGTTARALRGGFDSVPADTNHIDCWRYSPDCCERVVETQFANNM